MDDQKQVTVNAETVVVNAPAVTAAPVPTVPSIEVKVMVQPSAYELGQGLSRFVGRIKKTLDDGFQVGSDVPEIISASVSELYPIVSKLGSLKAESVNKKDFAMALALSLSDIVFEFVD